MTRSSRAAPGAPLPTASSGWRTFAMYQPKSHSMGGADASETGVGVFLSRHFATNYSDPAFADRSQRRLTLTFS